LRHGIYLRMLAENLKYLRHKHKESQQDLATAMGLPRTTLGDYERGKTEPNIAMLIKLAKHYKLKIDDLINSQISRQDLELIRNKDMRQDPEYIRDLPKISFPGMLRGTYRGFEINGDSMLPIESGSIIISRYVEKLTDIKSDNSYIIVSKNEGLVYKRLRLDKKNKQLILISDNDAYLPYTLDYSEVDEIWSYYAHLSFSDKKQSVSTLVEGKLTDIQLKLNQIQDTISSHR